MNLPMKPTARLRNPLGAEVTLIEPVRAALAPGLWRVGIVGIGLEFATEEGLIACGYTPIARGESADE